MHVNVLKCVRTVNAHSGFRSEKKCIKMHKNVHEGTWAQTTRILGTNHTYPHTVVVWHGAQWGSVAERVCGGDREVT